MISISAIATALSLAATPLAPDALAPAESSAPTIVVAADPEAAIGPEPKDQSPSIKSLVTPENIAPMRPPMLPAAPDLDTEIVVQARSGQDEPLEQLNVEGFEVTQAVDKAVFGPVARAYGTAIPRPIRKGLRNFLTNLREPIVAANYLLQLKIGKAGETLGRFAINSTVGVAGLIDQAKRPPFNLPRRRNGFANTLGYYGVKPGPFFYLPLIGPTTLRDFAGNVVDQLAAPMATVPPFDRSEYIAPVGLLGALDARNEFDEELERRRAGSDPYGDTRKIYLERRQAEIDALRAPTRQLPERSKVTAPPPGSPRPQP